MSGRDLRQFLSDRAGSFNVKPQNVHLVHSYATGSLKYHEPKRVDYDKLGALVEQYKQSGELKEKRVKHLAEKSSESKETMIMKQHREQWFKAKEKLLFLLRKTQLELESLYGTCIKPAEHSVPEHKLHPDPAPDIWKKLVEKETLLVEERESFRMEYIQPLLTLQEKLKSHCKHFRNQKGSSTSEVCRKSQQLKEELARTKEQWREIQKSMEQSLNKVEKEVLSEEISMLTQSGSTEERVKRMRAISKDLCSIDCPNEGLYQLVVSQFEQLAEYHCTVLSGLDEVYGGACGSPQGEWREAEDLRFRLIFEQYPSDLPDRRKLCFDRMRREMPHKSRGSILQHESWVEAQHYHQQRREACFRAWSRDREDLLLRAKALFREAVEEERAALEKEKEKDKQEAHCHDLHVKLSVWMEQKLEAMRLESHIAEMLQQEEAKRNCALTEREKRNREKNKKLLEAHLAEKEEEQRKSLEEKQKRLTELKRTLAEQEQHDRERVKYREEQRQQSLKDSEMKRLQALKAEEERQHRLEILRSQVKVDAPADPLRVLRETKAYQSRLLSGVQDGTPKELDLQAPLFSRYGFTDQQMGQDKRLRVEEALRKAGLHGSDYARQIIAAVPPPTQPRKDQYSTVFKDMNNQQ